MLALAVGMLQLKAEPLSVASLHQSHRNLRHSVAGHSHVAMQAPEPTPRSKGRPLASGVAPRRVGLLLIVAVALLALLALGPGDDGSAERQRLITFAWQDAPAEVHELVWDLGDALEGPTGEQMHAFNHGVPHGFVQQCLLADAWPASHAEEGV